MGRELDSAFFTEVDEWLRTGRPSAAVGLLREVPLKEVKRADAARFASLAYRAGAPALSLRLLNPIVRPEKGKIEAPASPAECVEYAAALQGVGAVTESLGILESVDRSKAPNASLMHAFGLIRQWRYSEAVPHLERYIQAVSDPYQMLIARTNLAASLIHNRSLDRAGAEIEACLEAARKAGATRLLGNALELSAQLLIEKRELGAARQVLEASLAGPAEVATLDRFFARKWLAICELIQSRGGEKGKQAVLKIREEALSRGHWETVRDCDAQLALHSRDAARLAHVIFGTPFADFRDRLLEELKAPVELPASFVWRAMPGGARSVEFDLLRGQLRGGDDADRLKPGLLLEVLRALCADFYRPFRPAALFATLFPGEFHNPRSSPHRVHELVLRLRHWLAEREIPLEIAQGSSAYQLVPARLGVRVARAGTPLSRAAFGLERLRAKLKGEHAISSRLAAEKLGISERSARRLLSAGATEGILMPQGAHSNRSYRFKPAP